MPNKRIEELELEVARLKGGMAGQRWRAELAESLMHNATESMRAQLAERDKAIAGAPHAEKCHSRESVCMRCSRLGILSCDCDGNAKYHCNCWKGAPAPAVNPITVVSSPPAELDLTRARRELATDADPS